jgi:hypothetical protein
MNVSFVQFHVSGLYEVSNTVRDIIFEAFMAVYSQRLDGTKTQRTTILYAITDVQQMVESVYIMCWLQV